MAVPIVQIFAAGEYEKHIRWAVELLNNGGIVVLPTETVYGAAVRLDHREALARLRELRAGGLDKPFTIHLATAERAQMYLGNPGELGQRLIRKLWPGPVGLMFEVEERQRKESADKLHVAETDLYDGASIILRCPDHIVATDIIAEVSGPVVATSAATEGVGRADQIAQDLDGKVDLVIDAGPPKYSKPSTLLRVRPDGYEIVRAGVYDARIIERLLKTTILFLCSGNTCRSPMAEGIARRLVAEKLQIASEDLENKGVSVISAGSFAIPGARATPQAVDVLKDLGIDLSRHRSRPLTVELINQADVIFTMGQSHVAAVAALVPSAVHKVQSLDPQRDIDDPIGGDVELYRELARQLRALIEQRLRDMPLP